MIPSFTDVPSSATPNAGRVAWNAAVDAIISNAVFLSTLYPSVGDIWLTGNIYVSGSLEVDTSSQLVGPVTIYDLTTLRAMRFSIDTAYDIGATSTYRPRDVYVGRTTFSTTLHVAAPSGVVISDTDAGGDHVAIIKKTDATYADGFYTTLDTEMILSGAASPYLGARTAQHTRVQISSQALGFGSAPSKAIAVRGAIDFQVPSVQLGISKSFEAECMLWRVTGSSFVLPAHFGFHALGIGGPGATKVVQAAYGFYADAQKVAGVTAGYGFYSAGATDQNYFAGTMQVGGGSFELNASGIPVLYIRSTTTSTGGSIAFYDSAWGSHNASITFDPTNSRLDIVGGTAIGVRLLTAGVAALTIDTSQNSTFAGTISATGATLTISTNGNAVTSFVSTDSFAPNTTTYLVGGSTSGAANVTLKTISTSSGSVTHIEAAITGIRVSGSTEVASYRIAGTFRNVSGTLTQRGSTTVIHSAEDQAGFDVSFSISGTSVLVIATGIASYTMQWTGHVVTITH